MRMAIASRCNPAICLRSPNGCKGQRQPPYSPEFKRELLGRVIEEGVLIRLIGKYHS